MFVLRKPLLAHHFRGEEVSTYRHLLWHPSKTEAMDARTAHLFQHVSLHNQALVLPPLPSHRETFALFGGDFMVHNLARVPWLVKCPIYYWGDLDAQGFQIRSRLRPLYPHVTSLMMDRETFTTFADFCVPSTPCPIRRLPHLTPKEHAPFVYLAEHDLRLEQERISHSDAVKQLISMLFL
jgi:hypothetical protein